MIGFIGAGNMGGAIIGGIIKANICSPSQIIAADKNEHALNNLKSEFKIKTTTDNIAAAQSDILFLAVKPQFLYDVIEQIKNDVSNETIIVSIAAGQSVEKIEKAFSREIKLVRVMPNTPALVGESMSALTPNKNISEKDLTEIKTIFESFGKAEIVSENLMDAVTAVSGSSPAYIFMLIEAMADAAVNAGMPRNQSYTFAAQAVLGSAKMVLDTGMHPGALKDMVCSPAGTTIEAVKVLEEKGFRAAVIDAMDTCVKKSRSM
jgi:pyrroline-5-carboxylate reductase